MPPETRDAANRTSEAGQKLYLCAWQQHGCMQGQQAQRCRPRCPLGLADSPLLLLLLVTQAVHEVRSRNLSQWRCLQQEN